MRYLPVGFMVNQTRVFRVADWSWVTVGVRIDGWWQSCRNFCISNSSVLGEMHVLFECGLYGVCWKLLSKVSVELG